MAKDFFWPNWIGIPNLESEFNPKLKSVANYHLRNFKGTRCLPKDQIYTLFYLYYKNMYVLT